MKNKAVFYIFLAIDILLIALCFWLAIGHQISFAKILLLYPQGAIAVQEKQLIINSVLLMLIGAIPVYFLIFFFAYKYRADKTAKYVPNLDSKWAELIWLIPGSIIFILSYINWQSTHALDPSKAIAPGVKPLTIEVVALQWKFLFIYPEQNIATLNFIEFPQNVPVHFELTADAPMSSFWIPQLGSQIYAMAGMQTQLNLIANTTGDFRGLDTEINGTGFSGMKFTARSATQADFNAWIQAVKQFNPALDLDSYNQLSAPSQNNPPAYFASVDPGLYDTVMMKTMMPMTSAQMQQMSSLGIGAMDNSSSTMNMPGMDITTSSAMDMQGMHMK